MTDLDRLQSEPLPRPSGLCSRYALRFEGIAGFVLYGVLWAFLCLFPALLVAVLLGMAHLASPIPEIGFCAVIAAEWALFALWAKRRLRPALPLFERGVLVDATIAEVIPGSGRADGYTRFVLSFRSEKGDSRASGSLFTGRGNSGVLIQGAPVKLLHLPGESRCAAFLFDGAMTCAVTHP